MGTKMKVFYLMNENKEIIQDDFDKFDDNCTEIDKDKYHIVNGYNGAVFLKDYTETEEYKQKALDFEKAQNLENLRYKRINECFSVINRGELWYERLTHEQKEELEIWYQEWLDVTKTKQEPNRPEWLN